MIPNYESFILRKITKDSLGKITGQVDTAFTGMSDEETVYDMKGGSLNIVGVGTVYTADASIEPVEGDEITVDLKTFVIARLFKAKTYGGFHHWEIVYG